MVLRQDGFKLNEDKFLIGSLTHACRLINDKVRTRKPITKNLVGKLIRRVKKYYDTQPYLSILYQTLFSTTYFGLFRVGQLTKDDYPVLAKNVEIGQNKKKIKFTLHTSKTHGKDTHSQTVKISSKSKKEP